MKIVCKITNYPKLCFGKMKSNSKKFFSESIFLEFDFVKLILLPNRRYGNIDIGIKEFVVPLQ